ncbi:hypothetical protein BCV71DRAFT_274140, partial [Rhizopus microsporus]
QLAVLQQQLNNNASPTSQLAEGTAPLHSVGTHSHYDWTSSDFLLQFLQLDTQLYTAPLLKDNDRKSINENYPPLAMLDYRPPSSASTTKRLMKRAQKNGRSIIEASATPCLSSFPPLGHPCT